MSELIISLRLRLFRHKIFFEQAENVFGNTNVSLHYYCFFIYINHYIIQFSICEDTHNVIKSLHYSLVYFYFVYKIIRDYNFLQGNLLIFFFFYTLIVRGLNH